MPGLVPNTLTNLATTANLDIQNFLKPIMASLIGLAIAAATLFIILAGISYMTSAGHPEKLTQAKRILKGAFIGLVLVIAATAITSILSSAYSSPTTTNISNLPALTAVDTSSSSGGLTEVLIKAIIGLFKNIIETAGKPFISALDYFTHATPLMADNPSVLKLWLGILGIANALFVAVVALMGFHFMSAAALGFEELSLKQLLPKLGLTFVAMNSSLFIIDLVISLSNAMIKALESLNNSLSVWQALGSVTAQAGAQGLVALLIMVVFLILAAILLIYYVMRIVTLYVGAILSPIIILLSLVPGFRDFSLSAAKLYLTNIFVLFVHVIILMLSASLFLGLNNKNQVSGIDPVMAMVLGVATLLTLLKTQGLMMQLTYVSVGPKALRNLGTKFMHGVSYATTRASASKTTTVIKSPHIRRLSR